jgi:NAD(P)-dependent dehydrogenase (short-subunit alcohol dehydrogenase family)
MKILVIGGTGTIGSRVVNELKKRHSVLTAGRSQGDFIVDIENEKSIVDMYAKCGKLDAVVVTTGKVVFEPLQNMNLEKYLVGIHSKLLGQVNMVLKGVSYMNSAGASFTLTSGILNHDPILQGSSAAMVNGAIDGFVRAAAIELASKSIRINVVSPTVLTESAAAYGDFFRGYKPVDAAEVALAYSKSVEGAQTGQLYRVGF